MKLRTLAILPLLTAFHTTQASTVTPGDLIDGGIVYRWTVLMGGSDSASFQRHVGAWSWEDNDLAALAGGDGVGWTHQSDWVALTLAVPTTFKVRLDRQAGVPLGGSTAGTEFMYPSFTIWDGWDNDGDYTDESFYNNAPGFTPTDVGAVAWAEDLTYRGHVNNSTETFSEKTWDLPAGNYSIVIGSNAASANAPGRQGYLATFTAVPEPTTGIMLLAGMLAIGAARRHRG